MEEPLRQWASSWVQDVTVNMAKEQKGKQANNGKGKRAGAMSSRLLHLKTAAKSGNWIKPIGRWWPSAFGERRALCLNLWLIVSYYVTECCSRVEIWFIVTPINQRDLAVGIWVRVFQIRLRVMMICPNWQYMYVFLDRFGHLIFS